MTQLLTDEEINTIDPDGLREGFARAIEAAVLAKLREQEPFGYFYSDQNGSWRQAHDPQFLHAHVPLYAHPMPPDDVIRDAERYRWLREQTKPEDFYSGAPAWEVSYQANGMGQIMRNEILDAAIDRAMKEQA